jgi:addiction module RelB/DinJ family antitoxin
MAKVAVNYKVDEELKQRVDKVLEQLDITPTMAVTGLYHYIDQNHTLPFLIKTQVATPKELEQTLINLYYGALFHLQSIYATTPDNTDREMLRLNHSVNQITLFTGNYLKQTAGVISPTKESAIQSLRLSLDIARAAAQSCNEYREFSKESRRISLQMAIKILSKFINDMENETKQEATE